VVSLTRLRIDGYCVSSALLLGALLSWTACPEHKPAPASANQVTMPAVAPAAKAPAAPPQAAPAPPPTGYTVGPVTEGGTVRGKVTLIGNKPVLPPVRCARDPDVCGKARPDQSLIVGVQNGIKNVLVSLTDIHSGKAATPAQATLDIKQCGYSPRVQALPVGSSLMVTNRDQIPHDLGGTFNGRNVFNRVVLKRSEKVDLYTAGVLTVGCDTHSGPGAAAGCETGVIGVMANPYFAITGDDGSYSIPDVPPGTYTLQAWHETLGVQTQKITLVANGTTAVGFPFAAKPK
jgi:Polysaccharide lyase family 4, domain II